MKRTPLKRGNKQLSRTPLRAKKPWNARSFLKRKKPLLSINNRKIRRITPNLKPKSPHAGLKKRLWRIFSKYIRLRWADRRGFVETCDGSYMHWTKVHCGHLFPNTERNSLLGGNELWYYENNFAPQTSNGNYFNANNSAKKYMQWAIEKYGLDEVQKMSKIRKVVKRFTEQELEEKYIYYSEQVKKLLRVLDA